MPVWSQIRFFSEAVPSALSGCEVTTSARISMWEDLVRNVKGGDEGAARALVEHLYPQVIRIIRGCIPQNQDEQDVAQEVFFKMFARLEQFRGDQPFPHWVSRIASNTCLDLLRRHKRRPEVRFADLSQVEADLLQSSLQQEEPAVAASAEGSELVDRLLATLKPAEQTVLRLLDLEQKSVQEICNLTGWGASKIKVTAMRARRKLAAILRRLEAASNR